VKKILKDYLLFSKKERIGIAIVLLLIGLFLYLPSWVKPRIQVLQHEDTAWLNGLFEVEKTSFKNNEKSNSKKTTIKPSYFYFDPNIATEDQFLLLGLTSKNAQTIIRYRSKGGQFRAPKDFLKIWGIEPAVAEALIPFIRITLLNTNKQSQAVPSSGGYNLPPQPIKFATIDINQANIPDWEALPGIGPVLANRIVKFRDKIGGFVEVEDVQKTYGIRDSLFNQIKPFLKVNHSGKPSINKASVALLEKAGVASVIAIAIVEYRTQYGNFESLEDLKKIVFIQQAQFDELLKLVKL